MHVNLMLCLQLGLELLNKHIGESECAVRQLFEKCNGIL